MADMAKVFQNGGSQAVRLPKSFRFDADEVCIKRIGSAVLLFHKEAAWDVMGEAIGKVDDDFMTSRDQPNLPEERPGL